MRKESIISVQNTRKKCLKVHRAQPIISRKIVAFHELLNLEKNKRSARSAAELLEIPNSTMQSWRRQKSNEKIPEELAEFFSTPVGTDFLQRNIMSVMKLMKCGPGGIQGMQEYLRITRLDNLIASSAGALQKFWVRCENHIIEFNKRQERELAPKIKSRKITAGLDEMFRGKRPCLVAMDVVSNYILLEKFTEDRKADTWKKELQPRLCELNVELGQVVSDLCGAIRSVTKELGAEHISELFHAQFEISKATSAPLSSQERASKKALNDAEEKVRKLKDEPRRLKKDERKNQLLEIEEAVISVNILKTKFERKAERREKVKKSVKEMGKIHHPIDLQSGKLQTAKRIEERFEEQFSVIDNCVEEAGLSNRCRDKIDKARRAFDAIVHYMGYFFTVYMAFVEGLRLSAEQEFFFNEIIFPLSYIRVIWRRLPRKTKEENEQLLKNLEAKAREGPWSEEFKQELMKKGREMAEKFQRSSSCVEGRNGVLSLNYHRYRRLNERTLKVLTIIHNYDTRRKDGTTAAERFFGIKHEDLFESLVENVRIPGRPQRQHHDEEKRMLAWEKRRAA